jgi:hypothetical protein
MIALNAANDAKEMAPVQEEMRRSPRSRTIKAGQISVGDLTIDCVVLDVSKGGARIYLRQPAEVPDQVAFKFKQGQSFAARVRWRAGEEIGFELTAADSASVHESDAADPLVKALETTNLSEVISLLQERSFSYNPEIMAAASDLHAAYGRLTAALARHVGANACPDLEIAPAFAARGVDEQSV